MSAVCSLVNGTVQCSFLPFDKRPVVIEDVNVRRSWTKGVQELSVLSVHLLLLNNEKFIKNKLKAPCKQED